MSGLAVSGVVRSFGGVEVLRTVELAVDAGRTLALVGPSGCGKTTLLRIVAGFERAEAGSVDIGGTRVVGRGLDVPPERRRVGYVAQEGALFPHLDVAGNVLFGLPRPQRRARHRLDELLELVGLDPGLARRLPHQLSGGQQQRVALARALAPSPALVLLDEPFAALDAGLREATRAGVLGAVRAAGATAVLVTHDQEEALSSADRVAVMLAGRVCQVGPPSAVYRAPADLAVASFLGSAVVLAGRSDGRRVDTVLGSLPVSADAAPTGDVDVLVRPEQVALTPALAGRGATVTELTFYGHDASAVVRLADGQVVRSRRSDVAGLAPGDSVDVTVQGAVRCYERAAPGQVDGRPQ